MKIGNFDLNKKGAYIIINYNGNLKNALDVDVIKLQTHTADTMALY